MYVYFAFVEPGRSEDARALLATPPLKMGSAPTRFTELGQNRVHFDLGVIQVSRLSFTSNLPQTSKL